MGQQPHHRHQLRPVIEQVGGFSGHFEPADHPVKPTRPGVGVDAQDRALADNVIEGDFLRRRGQLDLEAV